MQQIEKNAQGINNSGMLKSNTFMGHPIITATEEQYKRRKKDQQTKVTKKFRKTKGMQVGTQ